MLAPVIVIERPGVFPAFARSRQLVQGNGWQVFSVIVVLLWFYLSGLVLLFGAELNSEIEHASPYGKAEGEKVPGERRHWMFRSRHTHVGETPS